MQRNNPQELPPEFFAIFLPLMLVLVVVGLVISIMFLLTLSTALSRCSPENRKMEPGMVWLTLIPCFGFIWMFFVVINVSQSLKQEFHARRRGEEGDYGQGVGLAYLILSIAGAIPFIGGLFSIAGLVCLILYWVKIYGYSKRLLEMGDAGSPGFAAEGAGDRFGERPARKDDLNDDDRFRGTNPEDRTQR
jgi:hypothetical protein